MKKILITIMVLGLVLTGCQSTSKENDKLSVVTSFYPLYSLANIVGGEHVEVVSVLPVGAEAHSFEPSAKDRVKIENADVFVYHGAGFESWTDSVVKSLKGDKIETVEVSKAVQLRSNEDDHDDHDDHDHEGHDHGSFDPHTWLSPNNARLEARMIADSFIKKDPEHAQDYEANYQKFSTEIDSLIAEYTEAFANVKTRTMVVDHLAFGYLASDFNLEQKPIAKGIVSEEPTPKQIEEAIEFIKTNDIKTIYLDAFNAKKVVDVVVKETGVSIHELSTLETVSQEEYDKGVTYLDKMEENLKSLKEGLNE